MQKAKIVLQGDNRTGRAFREVNGSLGKMKSSVGNVVGSLRGMAAILGVGLFARAAKDSLEFADKVGKLNARLGASTEFLSEMKFAADQTGVSFETFTMGLQRMQRRVAEAAQGTGEAKNALAELGINAKKLVGLSLEDQFDVIAEALNGVGNQSDKVRLAMKLFDSEGVALLQTMEGGAGAVRSLREEGRALGATLTSDMTAGAEAANDAFSRIQTSLRGVVTELAINFAPALEVVGNFLAVFIPGAINLANAAFAALAGAAAKAFTGVLVAASKGLGGLAAAMEYFWIPGAGGVQGASDNLQEFANSVNNWGTTTLVAAGQSAKLAIGIKQIGTSAAAAKASVEELVASVAGGGPDGSESVKGLDALWKGAFDFAYKRGKKDNQVLDDLSDSVAGALVSGLERGGQGMKEVFKGILADLAAQMLKSNLVSLFAKFGFGAASGGAGGGLPGKQAGGQVVPGVYRVGESGPETLAIGQRAMVYANRGSGGGGGGSNVYNIDARGAGPNAAAEIQRAIQQAEAQTMARIIDQKRRGRFR